MKLSVAEGSCSEAELVCSRAANLGAMRVFVRQGNARAVETLGHTGRHCQDLDVARVMVTTPAPV